MLVAFDKGKTFRHDEFKEYKFSVSEVKRALRAGFKEQEKFKEDVRR